MMSGPGVVRIGRKRSLPAIERFIVEPSGKRNKVQIQYVLQKDDEQNSEKVTEPQSRQESEAAQQAVMDGDEQAATSHTPGNGAPTTPLPGQERRIFHLKRPVTSSPTTTIGKRKHRDHGIATFVEKRVKRPSSHAELRDLLATDASVALTPPLPQHQQQQFKRPGKSAGKGLNRSPLTTPSPVSSDLESMADSLHCFAMEEAAKEAARESKTSTEAKPKLLSLPKLSGQRSRELHRLRVANAAAAKARLTKDTDVEMEEEEADYVYDTYVLASSESEGAAQVEAQAGLGSVGYLVITEEDQAVWETFLEEEPSDKDWDSDEDDENAEDWYGADYPDEELALDDEFDRNPYAYRAHGASDDEEWNADEQSWSDDEYERQANPWRSKTPQQFSKYLMEPGQADED